MQLFWVVTLDGNLDHFYVIVEKVNKANNLWRAVIKSALAQHYLLAQAIAGFVRNSKKKMPN